MNPNNILELLSKGDKRTTGHVDDAVAATLKDSDLVATLVDGLASANEGTVMRCVDALQKVHARKPRLLESYLDRLFTVFTGSAQQELRWHMAQILPAMPLNDHQATAAVSIWADDVRHAHSNTVRTFSLQALHDIAVTHPQFAPQYQTALTYALEQDIPSLRARARRLQQHQ